MSGKEGLIEEVHWLEIFRVHTCKPSSHMDLFKSMHDACGSVQGITFKTIIDNWFLVQFLCLGDWNKVMGGGPWLFFRGRGRRVLDEYNGFTNVQEYKLDIIPRWTWIMGVPEGLMK